MLETVKIENFRRINSLELSGLQAINIFLGTTWTDSSGVTYKVIEVLDCIAAHEDYTP